MVKVGLQRHVAFSERYRASLMAGKCGDTEGKDIIAKKREDDIGE
jgi:hypothetical protein